MRSNLLHHPALRPTSDETTDARKRFGAFIRETRHHRGLTLREAEAQTGIPFAHLSLIERGLVDPKLTSVVRLLEWAA